MLLHRCFGKPLPGPVADTGKLGLAVVDVALTARCTLHDMCVLSHATMGLLLHVLRATLLRWVLLCFFGRIYNGQFNYLTSIIRLQIGFEVL